MSGVYTKKNGQFVLANSNTKYLNNWTDTFQIYTKISSTWKKVYNYYYTYSSWSSCSKTCGGGVQTRTSTCNRSDGAIKPDSYCKRYGLTKAALSQSCNTQSCIKTLYIYGNADDYIVVFGKLNPNDGFDTWISKNHLNWTYNFKANQVGPVAFTITPGKKTLLYIAVRAWDDNRRKGGLRLRMCQGYHESSYDLYQSWSDCSGVIINTGYISSSAVTIYFTWDLTNNVIKKYTCTNTKDSASTPCNDTSWCKSFCPDSAKSCGCSLSNPFNGSPLN